MVRDSSVPVERNLERHELMSEDSSSTRRWFVTFYYTDGCIRQFNGVHWKVLEESRAVRNSNMVEQFWGASV